MNFYEIKADDKEDYSYNHGLGGGIVVETEDGQGSDIDIRYHNRLAMWYEPSQEHWEVMDDREVDVIAACIEALMEEYGDLVGGAFANEIIKKYTKNSEVTREDFLDNIRFDIPEEGEEDLGEKNERSFFEARLESVKEQKNDYREEMEELEEKLEEKKGKIRALRSDNQQLTSKVASREDTVEELKEEKTKLQAELDAYKDITDHNSVTFKK